MTKFICSFRFRYSVGYYKIATDSSQTHAHEDVHHTHETGQCLFKCKYTDIEYWYINRDIFQSRIRPIHIPLQIRLDQTMDLRLGHRPQSTDWIKWLILIRVIWTPWHYSIVMNVYHPWCFWFWLSDCTFGHLLLL